MSDAINLSQQTCEACRADAPRVSEQELVSLLKQVPDWETKTREGVLQLERQYPFKSFADAMKFAVDVGELAESEGHHPAILVEWGKTTVTWWTHKIGGLHRNDFIMAARTDRLKN